MIKIVSITRNQFLYLVLVYSIVCLLASYFTECFLKIDPCKLCLLQRIPLALIGLFAGIGLRIDQSLAIFRVLQSIILLGIGFAFYHLVIQIGVLPDPCKIKASIGSIEDFRAMMSSSECKKITWSIFGIPISGILGASYLGLLAISTQIKRI